MSSEYILVMNEITFENFKKTIFGKAIEQSDPIRFVKDSLSAEIIIDEEAPDGVVEKWTKKSYEQFKEERGY